MAFKFMQVGKFSKEMTCDDIHPKKGLGGFFFSQWHRIYYQINCKPVRILYHEALQFYSTGQCSFLTQNHHYLTYK